MRDLGPRLLSLLEDELLPATERAVAAGNKIFGAALLDRETLETVLVGTNNETENPLWGEVHTIKLYHDMPDRPPPKRLIFFSTHEPCSMCLSAITWAGFDNFTYLFSHEDSRISPSRSPMTCAYCRRSSASPPAPTAGRTRSGRPHTSPP